MRHRMAVLLLEDVLPLDFAIPTHIFARELPEFYDVVTASPTGKPVHVAGGMQVIPDGGLEQLRTARTIVIPGYADAANRVIDPLTLRVVTKAAAGGTRVVSICSGAFALAQTGLLDGLSATTHWSLCDSLAGQHPAISVQQDVLFVDSGHVATSGGVTAGVDLCLHLLKKDLGAAIANSVSRRIVMARRPPRGQAQFIEAPPTPPGDDPLSLTQQWALSELGGQISVADMAHRTRMSVRTFHRRFHERTGRTPAAWLQAQRVLRSKEFLESTDHSIEQIADEVGMGAPANLRSAFKKETNISPAEYRRQYNRR